jgi:phosphoglycolate phosphatase-like HAD superfamily hydrolase
VKALFIDLDMTLVDTSRELIMAIAKVESEYRLGIRINRDPRLFIKAYYEERIPGLGNSMKKWHFWRSVWMKYLENGRYGEPMPCSDSLLLTSSGRYLTAIVTGREVETRMLIEELHSYGFPTNLVRIHSTGDLWPGATKRDLYEQLARIYTGLGISREEIMVISDSPRDIRFAREAGFRVIGYIPFKDPEVISMIEHEAMGTAIDTLCINNIL